jgi:iron complex outermembrane receptor protein
VNISRYQYQVAAALAACLAIAAPAVAASAALDFHIAEQPLPAAIAEFSSQSGYQVLFPYDLLKAVRTRPVKGHMSPQQAVAAMVQGTGITVSPVGTRSFSLKLAKAGQAAHATPVALTRTVAATVETSAVATDAEDAGSPEGGADHRGRQSDQGRQG